ncbi:hypothetical protein HK099_006610 [Clydaea vesicula]|uniref:Multidrug and toxic compound extrusion protein n=1 Tax=Clydaea vesicula TaxID=447962 RepID=A0AAD5U288_9FUNG|nr:hypothetical protein HK099_006610 [Clydaea vesicula]
MSMSANERKKLAEKTFNDSDKLMIDRLRLYISKNLEKDAGKMLNEKRYKKLVKTLNSHPNFPAFQNNKENSEKIGEKIVEFELATKEQRKKLLDKIFKKYGIPEEPRNNLDKRHREKYIKGDLFEDVNEMACLIKVANETTTDDKEWKQNYQHAEKALDDLYLYYTSNQGNYKGSVYDEIEDLCRIQEESAFIEVDEDSSTPLLSKGHLDCCDKISLKLLAEQASSTVKLAIPLSFGYCLQNSLQFITIVSLGHVGTKELAACAIGTMWANVTGFSIGIGAASALDTLCSQAHTGSTDKFALGKHLQRSLTVMTIISIFISIFWYFFTERLLILTGQEPDIARLSTIYICWLIPGLIPNLFYECIKRYLQCQKIMSGVLFVIILASPLNMFLQWFLVWGPLSLGFIGMEKYGGFEFKEAFNLYKIKEFLTLGIPGILMTCAEWWAFEIMYTTLASGLISETALAAQSIVFSLLGFTWLLQLGISIACSTKVGNFIGSKHPNFAKVTTFSTLILAIFVACFNSSFLLLFKDKLGLIFTANQDVINTVSSIIPLGSFFQFSDGFNCVGGGVLRGLGQQKIGALMNVIGFYGLAIPLGFYLAFSLNWGLLGLWSGLATTSFCVSIFETYWISNVDWEAEVQKAEKLLSLNSTESYCTFNEDEGSV